MISTSSRLRRWAVVGVSLAAVAAAGITAADVISPASAGEAPGVTIAVPQRMGSYGAPTEFTVTIANPGEEDRANLRLDLVFAQTAPESSKLVLGVYNPTTAKWGLDRSVSFKNGSATLTNAVTASLPAGGTRAVRLRVTPLVRLTQAINVSAQLVDVGTQGAPVALAAADAWTNVTMAVSRVAPILWARVAPRSSYEFDLNLVNWTGSDYADLTAEVYLQYEQNAVDPAQFTLEQYDAARGWQTVVPSAGATYTRLHAWAPLPVAADAVVPLRLRITASATAPTSGNLYLNHLSVAKAGFDVARGTRSRTSFAASSVPSAPAAPATPVAQAPVQFPTTLTLPQRMGLKGEPVEFTVTAANPTDTDAPKVRAQLAFQSAIAENSESFPVEYFDPATASWGRLVPTAEARWSDVERVQSPVVALAAHATLTLRFRVTPRALTPTPFRTELRVTDVAMPDAPVSLGAASGVTSTLLPVLVFDRPDSPPTLVRGGAPVEFTVRMLNETGSAYPRLDADIEGARPAANGGITSSFEIYDGSAWQPVTTDRLTGSGRRVETGTTTEFRLRIAASATASTFWGVRVAASANGGWYNAHQSVMTFRVS
jgi:hypothetical protein